MASLDDAATSWGRLSTLRMTASTAITSTFSLSNSPLSDISTLVMASITNPLHLVHLFFCSLVTASLLDISALHQNHARQLAQPLHECLSQTSTNTVYPSSPDYNETAQSQNTNYHYNPAAIVLPKSTQKVAAAIKCVAAQQNTKISTFGGGHGYAAYALGGSDGYVVIDSQDMQDLHIDEGAKTVRVGMGMRAGPLSKAIGAKGFLLPHGTCSSIGLVGHSLGGGWGFTSRNYGWTLDQIVGIEYVDARGEVRNVGKGSGNQDIWWAMRGAGANNFGVITHITFALTDAPKKSLNWKTTLPKNQDCGAALLTLQELGMRQGALPKELGFQLNMYGEGTPGTVGACSLSGQYFGSEEEFRQLEIIFEGGLERRGVEGYKQANVSEFGDWVETLTDLQGIRHSLTAHEYLNG